MVDDRQLLEMIHHWLKSLPYQAPEVIEQNRQFFMSKIEDTRSTDATD